MATRRSGCFGNAAWTGFLVVIFVASSSGGWFTKEDPRYCYWYGTVPFCSPTCPDGRVKAEGRETKCGDSLIFCCLTGRKIVCCPAGFDFDTEPVFAKMPPASPNSTARR